MPRAVTHIGRSLVLLAAINAMLGAAVQLRPAPFLDGHRAAVSFCFDTGVRDHVEIVAPAFSQRGMHGSFFVVAGWTPKSVAEAQRKDPLVGGAVAWPEWRDLGAAGHEIACLSWSHPYLTRIDADRLRREIHLAIQTIERRVGRPVWSYAAPHGAVDENVRRQILERVPLLRQGCIEVGGSGFAVDRAIAEIDRAMSDGRWLGLALRGISAGYAAIGQDGWQHLLTRLDQIREECWIAPYGQVGLYRALREALVFEQQAAGSGLVIRWRLPAATEFDDQEQRLPALSLEGQQLSLLLGGAEGYRCRQDGNDLPTASHGRQGERLVTIALDGGPLELLLIEE